MLHINGIMYNNLAEVPMSELKSLKTMMEYDVTQLGRSDMYDLLTIVQNVLDEKGLGWNPTQYLNDMIDEEELPPMPQDRTLRRHGPRNPLSTLYQNSLRLSTFVQFERPVLQRCAQEQIEEEEEELFHVELFGMNFLQDDDNNLYDDVTMEYIGMYNPAQHTIYFDCTPKETKVCGKRKREE